MLSSLLGFFGCGGKPAAKEPSWPKSRPLAKLDNVRGVAADAGFVYAGNFDFKARRGTIVRVAAEGGALETVVADAGLVEHLRVFEGYLYWNGDGALRRVKLTGGAVETVARGSVPAHEFVIAEGRLWFSAGIPLGGDYWVYSVPLAGGEAVKHHETKLALSHPIPAGDSIFWISPRGLVKMARNGGGPVEVYTAGDRITSGLTRDADAFYFFHQGSTRQHTSIVRYSIADGKTTAIPAGYAQTALELMPDGGRIYYLAAPTSLGAYELRWVPKSGGEAVTLDSGYSGGQLAANEKHVFLLTVNEIVAVAKG